MIKKILVFLLVFAILLLVKEAFSFYKAFKKGEQDMTTARLIYIGVSISYIITIISTGFSF